MIWKYPLAMVSEQQISVPEGAEFLSVHPQREEICVWALVYPASPKVKRGIRIIGTGHEFNETELGRYIGTVHMRDGTLVLHVFEMARGG